MPFNCANRFSLALVLMLWPGIGWSQVLGKGSEEGISLFRISTLLIFFALLLGGAFLLARFLGLMPLQFFAPVKERRIKLIESLRLGPQTGLHIVSIDGEDKLLVFTQNGASVIAHGTPAMDLGEGDES